MAKSLAKSITESTPRPTLSVGVHEAKTRLSELLRFVEAGQVVEIHRGSVPVARLVPAQSVTRRTFGSDAGRVIIADDFDAPLDAQTLAGFGIE